MCINKSVISTRIKYTFWTFYVKQIIAIYEFFLGVMCGHVGDMIKNILCTINYVSSKTHIFAYKTGQDVDWNKSRIRSRSNGMPDILR